MSSLSQCRTCGCELTAGPEVERSDGNQRFSCTVRGIPTRVCPLGCPGAYWYWPDFGVEVLQALDPDSPNIAKRKRAFFKTHHFCRHCNEELTDRHESAQFTFNHRLHRGMDLELSIEAPCLECPLCGSKYVPSQLSSGDPYYVELIEVVGLTITKDLIWK